METEMEFADASPRTGRSHAFWVPVVLILIWGIWDLCIFRLFDEELETVAGKLAFGSFYGQPVLAALWGAWGPGRAVVRWPVAFGLVVLQAVCCMIDGDVVRAFVLLAIAFSACSVLLLIGRRLTGWSMHHGEGVSSEKGSFGVRYLLGLTTFVALLAGLARATDALERIPSEVMVGADLALLALVFVLFTTPVALVFIATLMTGPQHMTRLIVVLFIGIAAALGISLLTQVQLGGSIRENFCDLGAVGVGAGATVGVSAVLLRWAGYRVGRKEGNSEVGAGGSLEG